MSHSATRGLDCMAAALTVVFAIPQKNHLPNWNLTPAARAAAQARFILLLLFLFLTVDV